MGVKGAASPSADDLVNPVMVSGPLLPLSDPSASHVPGDQELQAKVIRNRIPTGDHDVEALNEG